MQQTILIIQVVVSILMTFLILSQNKDGGLASSMGGGQSFQSVKRGAEKVVFIMTAILAAAFLVNAFLVVLF